MEGRHARFGTLGEKYVAMAVGKYGAALVTKDRRVGARHMVHVGHLLRVPPPVRPGSALMVRGGAEIHGPDIDHVPIKILQGAVVLAAAVPAQLMMPRQIPAHDMHGFSVDV